MSSSLQQRSSISSDNNVAIANSPAAPINIQKSEDSGRFSKLRNVISGPPKDANIVPHEPIAIESAPRYSKGLVLDVIPPKQADRRVIAQHFPNAARRMKEFSSAPKPAKPKSDVLGTLKDSIFGPKVGAVVKGERNDDGSHIRITPEDELLWRRLHLRAIDKERQTAGTLRSAQFIKAIKEKKHAENKLWKQRVERMRSSKDEGLKQRKIHLKQTSEEASARHKALMDERVRKLAFKDKVRTMKVKKIEAGRKIEHKFLKKNFKNMEHSQ